MDFHSFLYLIHGWNCKYTTFDPDTIWYCRIVRKLMIAYCTVPLLHIECAALLADATGSDACSESEGMAATGDSTPAKSILKCF